MKRRYDRMVLCSIFVLALLFMESNHVHAAPALQLYSPDAEYVGSAEIGGVPVTESWLIPKNFFSMDIIGASSPKKVDMIRDVTLWIAIQEEDFDSNPSGSVAIRDMGGNILVPEGPFFGTPDLLSPHGVYPAYYYQYSLPDLDVGAADSGIYDYNENYDPNNPGTPAGTGDIQRYIIAYTDFSWLHIDLSGTAWDLDGKKPDSWKKFAPYSHDADAPPTPTPLPATMVFLVSGLIILAGSGRKIRNRRSRRRVISDRFESCADGP